MPSDSSFIKTQSPAHESEHKSMVARLRRNEITRFLLLFEAVVLALSALSNLFFTEYLVVVIVETVFSIVALITYFYLNKSKNQLLAGWVSSLLLALFIIFLVIYTQGKMNTFALVMIYPLLSFAVLDKKHGTISFVFYSAIILAIILYGQTHWAMEYPAESFVNVFIALLTCGITIYYFEHTKEEAIQSLYQTSITDELTGLWNRKMFEQTLQTEIAYANRHKTPLSMAIFDLDFFKHINDHYGHDIGDIILQQFSQLLKKRVRQEDYVARWGGEEFALILPNTNIEGAKSVVRTILACVRKFDFEMAQQITVSAGIGEYHPGLTPQEFFRLVDHALYQAKKQGRDQYQIAKKTIDELESNYY